MTKTVHYEHSPVRLKRHIVKQKRLRYILFCFVKPIECYHKDAYVFRNQALPCPEDSCEFQFLTCFLLSLDILHKALKVP